MIASYRFAASVTWIPGDVFLVLLCIIKIDWVIIPWCAVSEQPLPVEERMLEFLGPIQECALYIMRDMVASFE